MACRNNGWAISVPRELQTASETIAQKAVAYGIHGERVDGNDLLAVHAATRRARERAAAGEGPTLLECVTYRVEGHSTSDDPRAYRGAEEVEAWRARDPILRLARYLGWKRLVGTPGETDAFRAEARERVRRAVEEAEAFAAQAARSRPSSRASTPSRSGSSGSSSRSCARPWPPTHARRSPR